MTPIMPLDFYRQVIGYNPFHFWGLSESRLAPLQSACNGLVTEYAWQNTDAAGRAELREAIERAEVHLTEQLGWSPAPHFREETISWPPYHTHEQDSSYMGSDWRWKSVTLSEGKVIAAGVESLTAIQLAAVITPTDVDGDGLFDTFTIGPIATTVTDPAQVAVYFNSLDRFDSTPASARWRIAPVTVSISGGFVTIKGPYWLLVKPVLYQGVAQVGRSPLVPTNFASVLDVYERGVNVAGTTLDTAQAVLYWETAPYPFCSTPVPNVNQSDPAAYAYALARVSLRDTERGIVGIGEASYDSTSGQWSAAGLASAGRPPDRVVVRYFAGAAYESPSTQNMQSDWRTTVTRFAIAEAMHRISACDNANREVYRWMQDLSRAAGSLQEQYRISNADLGNPFGTRAGQVEAWRVVNQVRRVVGVMA